MRSNTGGESRRQDVAIHYTSGGRMPAEVSDAMSVNIERPDYDEQREQDGFRAQRARLSRQAGAERLGLSLWEVPPGEAAYPYHAHLTEEEIVVVLEGTPSLRTPGGWRDAASRTSA